MTRAFRKPRLPRLRTWAESLMADSCRITRPGHPVTDPATGVAMPVATVVYTGPCKVQTAGGLAAENTEARRPHAPCSRRSTKDDSKEVYTWLSLQQHPIWRPPSTT